jgi:antitoxin MazE
MRVARWGNSLAVRIPQPVAEQARLGEGDEVEVLVEDGAVTIRRLAADEELERLVAAITPENRHDETDWGPARGREAW